MYTKPEETNFEEALAELFAASKKFNDASREAVLNVAYREDIKDLILDARKASQVVEDKIIVIQREIG